MATQPKNRRIVLLALLLALIAAATICVWGAAAAGYTFSSPALRAFFDFITPGDARGDATVSNGDGGGDGGDDGVGEPGDGDDGGGTAGGDNCLLGLICLDASVSVGGSVSADDDGDDDISNVSLEAAVEGNDGARCFLNLICLHVAADMTADGPDNVLLNADVAAEADKDGLDIDAEADLNADSASDGESCFLGLICLNADLDAISSNGVSATAAAQASVQSWWDSFVQLFASADV